MGRPIREANSPITLSLTTSMRSMFGLEVPDLRPIKGLDGIILKRKKNNEKYETRLKFSIYWRERRSRERSEFNFQKYVVNFEYGQNGKIRKI